MRSSATDRSAPETTPMTSQSTLPDVVHKPKSIQRMAPPREDAPVPVTSSRPPPLPFAANDLKVVALEITIFTDAIL